MTGATKKPNSYRRQENENRYPPRNQTPKPSSGNHYTTRRQTPKPPRAGTGSNEPGNQSGSVRKTVLITDSMLRLADQGSLGKGHSCHVINRRSWETTTTLKRQETLEELTEVNPENLYIHLGINDIHSRISKGNPTIPSILENAKDFLNEVKQSLPNCRITLSLPTLTNNRATNGEVIELRKALRDLAKSMGLTHDNNRNFSRIHVDRDGLHPNKSGNILLLGNFRHNIHRLYVTTTDHETQEPLNTD
eukprot:sb/3468800/